MIPKMKNRIWIKDLPTYVGKDVFIAGWVNIVRSHGKLLFVDVRDVTAEAQAVFGSFSPPSILELGRRLRQEWVVGLFGTVRKRPSGMENPKLPTGTIELAVTDAVVFSEARTPPFAIEGDGYDVSEEKRLRWRYLDLRRTRLKRNLIIRNRVIDTIREFLRKEGFVEIETPILTKSTPEGARDFLVPSRLQKGHFYALPQSPQQYKQLLQVAGFERYFQIARCFRDEDPRADRQAEFTQLDIEMSFVEQEDILQLIENLYVAVITRVFPEKKITRIPFPRISYRDAIQKYHTDKPDLRQDKKNPNELSFAFVVDFPMFEWRKEEVFSPAGTKKKKGRWDAVHHPFTKIKNPFTNNKQNKITGIQANEEEEERFIEYCKKNPGSLLAEQYDFVLNGFEIGGGSIREHNPRILEAVFEIMGHKSKEIKAKFGHLLEAFSYGVPPHGGIAPGIDRFVAVVLGESSIREVIAFPKTGDNRDLMMGAPSEIEQHQLEELGIEIKKRN